MAFGIKLGGKSTVDRLVAGRLKDDEKQTLLAQLNQSPPPPAELVPLLFQEDPLISARGAQLFLAKTDPEAIVALINGTIDPESTFASGLKVIQKCRPEQLVKALEISFAVSGAAVPERLWEIALNLEPNISDRYVQRAVDEARGPARGTAIKRLVKSRGAEASLPVLASAARSSEPSVRKEAVLALATLATEEVFKLMLDRLAKDDSAEVRDLAASYLSQNLAQSPADLRPGVLGRLLLASAAEQHAKLVQSVLGEGNPAELLPGLLTFCKKLTVAQHAVVMLALKSAGPALLAPAIELLKSPEADLRIQSVLLLQAIGDPRALQPLVSLLRDHDPWVRTTLCEALPLFKDVRLIAPLKEVFNDMDAKWAAIEAVGMLGGEKALDALLPLLDAKQPDAQLAVMEALRNIALPRTEAALTEMASKDVTAEVKVRALEVLRSFKEGTPKAGAAGVTSQQLTKPLDKMLAYTREKNGSDLLITPGEPPVIRINSALVRLQSGKLAAEHTKQMLMELLDPIRAPILEKHGAVDFCHVIPGVGRYRANLFKMKRGYSASFRCIPNTPPTFAELGLPKTLADIAHYHQGVVLVTGPAGSGKSTTLTALINFINESKLVHVLSFEEPVEFIHTPKKALINQREVGRDTASYSAAMRGALREDPDIIVVGDLRDPDTVRLALMAAETGHLVIATLQTTGAVASIDKIVESFPPEEQPQVRTSLSESLKLVVSQVLVPRADGNGRVGAFEILKSTNAVRSTIRDGKTFQLPSTMVIGKSVGMQMLDDHLGDLVRNKTITFETAVLYAQNKDAFARAKGAGTKGTPAPFPTATNGDTAAPGLSPAAPPARAKTMMGIAPPPSTPPRKPTP